MARLPRLLVALTAVVGVAALASPGTASAAQVAAAAETAYNTKTQYLTDDPDSGMAVSCVERRIYLASGSYDWAQMGGLGERPNLYLGTGWYTWRDCLDPQNGHYDHETALDPDNSSWQTVYLHGDWAPEVPGDWTWGSYLDPRF